MRFKILPVLYLLSFVVVNAQTYHPVIETNKYWDVFHRGDPLGLCWNDASRYYVSGDTAFDGKQYAIIKSYNILSYNSYFCPPYYVDTIPNHSLDFYLREDTEAKTLYRFPGFQQTNQESLLFDFSAKVGDTIPEIAGPSPVISRIDSVMLLNGEFRKAFYIRACPGCDSNLYAIEGIGLSIGFKLIPTVCECDFQLACVKYHNIPIFSFSNIILDSFPCYFFAGIPETQKKKVEISPNPAENYFSINTGNEISLPLQVSIFNTEGERMRYFELNDHETSIDVNKLTNGMYIIRLSNAYLSLDKKLIISR